LELRLRQPPVHAFDDPTLCRGEVGNLLPSHIFVLLGSEPIVFPMNQIEIENWCVDQRAKSFGKTALAGAAVANDECTQFQAFRSLKWRCRL
jgi:hypothetical protein